MSIPVAVSGVVGYLDEVPFGFIDDISDVATVFADRPIGFIAIEIGFGNMKQKKASGWETIE